MVGGLVLRGGLSSPGGLKVAQETLSSWTSTAFDLDTYAFGGLIDDYLATEWTELGILDLVVLAEDFLRFWGTAVKIKTLIHKVTTERGYCPPVSGQQDTAFWFYFILREGCMPGPEPESTQKW